MLKNPNFKKHLDQDIDRIILNNTEFSDWFIVNGLRIRGVFTNDQLGTTSMTQDRDLLPVGLTNANKVFYCASDDVPASLMRARTITINNTIYQVLRTSDEMGMMAFTLQHTESKANRKEAKRDGFYFK